MAQKMKRISLILLLSFLIIGCASAPVQIAGPECDRMVYNPRTGEFDILICLGETITWDGIEYRLLAEAIHPESKTLIAFFDSTGDCEIDGVGIYIFSEGIYYLRGEAPIEEALQKIRRTEEATGLELLKQVTCLKN